MAQIQTISEWAVVVAMALAMIIVREIVLAFLVNLWGQFPKLKKHKEIVPFLIFFIL
jgi:hypothetical protein